jgi:spermidine synthase
MLPAAEAELSRVQVRRGRRGLELRVDGTLASALGDSHARPVWAALAAPLLLLPEARQRRLLILGLGGGSAAHWLRELAPGADIVGVERDADVVAAARGDFGMDRLRVKVVLGDALAFLRRERRRFDLIIEDVFVGPSRSIRKPPWLPEPGLELALRRLARGGLLACNTIHEGPSLSRALRRRGPVLEVAVAGYWNRVYVAGARGEAGELRRRLDRHPRFAATGRALRLRSLARLPRRRRLRRRPTRR